MIQRAAVTILVLLVVASSARAHNLEVAIELLPRWQIQIRAWYEGDGPASGARFDIIEADGQLLGEGRLDRNGLARFFHYDTKDLRVVVSIAGHRAEQTLPGEALTRRIFCTCAACLAPEPSPFFNASMLVPAPIRSDEVAARIPLSEYGSNFPIWGLLGGVGFLLAVAAVFMWRTMRKT
jgi:hypothetical protein